MDKRVHSKVELRWRGLGAEVVKEESKDPHHPVGFARHGMSLLPDTETKSNRASKQRLIQSNELRPHKDFDAT